MMKKNSLLTFLVVSACAFPVAGALGADYRWNSSYDPSSYSVAGNWQVWNGSSWTTATTAPTASDNIVTPNLYAGATINDVPGNSVNNFTVDLSANWRIMNPPSGSVARTYTIEGDLAKSGSGSLLFHPYGTTSPGYTLSVGGNVQTNGGVLLMGSSGIAMTSVSVGGSTTVASGATLRVNADSATFGALTVNGRTYVHDADISGGSTGGLTASSLSGNSGTVAAKSYGSNASTATLTLNGSGASVSSYAGLMVDGTGTGTTLALLKSGSYTQVLTGSNTYSGGTLISGGSLFVNNASGSGTGTAAVSVGEGLLGGTGIITGAVQVGDGTGSFQSALVTAGVAEGDIGTLSMGALDMAYTDAAYVVDMNSDSGTADLINVNGSANLGSGLASLIVSDQGRTSLSAGYRFTIISTLAGVSGYFDGLGEGDTVVIGANIYRISYGIDLDDSVTLTVVPEASSGLMGALGALLVVVCQCRRRRS
ncbi:hypothetical protein H5P28_16710 [Ruficoccus amylovorans]|uniref:Autotransporter-associated beta strand repeat protein n=1 Tax=Ruficoccus amylovorans TaxID=1804625 RepID=A0A842HIU8_9BACT|nr:autotransporter-associated beta strand repeat-containing protein [Ruficoccus amylovorans]MBC2595908.1 hypothetical protein [Ruficoccus amylovorans]